VKTRSVQMHTLTVPLSAIEKLSDKQRFAYYLLGHISNELICMQKLVGFALPKHNDRRPARLNPELGQAMFLFRLASGKVWEAGETIRKSKELASVLRADVLPHLPQGTQRLKEVNLAINNAKWLSPLRNGMGFHYPTFERWSKLVAPDESWMDDVVYLGTQSGNTYHDAADTIAQAWMFGQYEGGDPRRAVDPLIGEMISLLGLFNTFLEDALGVFVSHVILAGGGAEPKPAGKVLAPDFESVAVPFWTAMPPRRSSR
jgi:hypothetical protein